MKPVARYYVLPIVLVFTRNMHDQCIAYLFPTQLYMRQDPSTPRDLKWRSCFSPMVQCGVARRGAIVLVVYVPVVALYVCMGSVHRECCCCCRRHDYLSSSGLEVAGEGIDDEGS